MLLPSSPRHGDGHRRPPSPLQHAETQEADGLPQRFPPMGQWHHTHCYSSASNKVFFFGTALITSSSGLRQKCVAYICLVSSVTASFTWCIVILVNASLVKRWWTVDLELVIIISLCVPIISYLKSTEFNEYPLRVSYSVSLSFKGQLASLWEKARSRFKHILERKK